MESIRKNYLIEKYKDVFGEDLPTFEQALEEAHDHAFSFLLDADINYKDVTKEILLNLAKIQPEDKVDGINNYHKDIYKTICFYEKYKNKVSKPNIENFKSAVYYNSDEAFEEVEKLELKDRKKMLLLSGFLGPLGAGSFYLGRTKQTIYQVIVTMLLFAVMAFVPSIGVLTLTLIVDVAVLLALAFRWAAEVDMCKYYINVINGQKIIDTLRGYRNTCGGKLQPQQTEQHTSVGKPYAICAFVFAILSVLVLISIGTCFLVATDLASLPVITVEAKELIATLVSAILSQFIGLIFIALISDTLLVYSYISLAQNVKNRNPVKPIAVFSALATVFANVAIVVSLIFVLL